MILFQRNLFVDALLSNNNYQFKYYNLQKNSHLPKINAKELTTPLLINV